MNKISGEEFDKLKKLATKEFEQHLEEMKRFVLIDEVNLEKLLYCTYRLDRATNYDYCGCWTPISFHPYFNDIVRKFVVLKIAEK